MRSTSAVLAAVSAATTADAAVNVSRFYHIDAEAALSSATDKFIRRFKAVEQKVIESDRDMKELSLEELDAIWDEVKASK